MISWKLLIELNARITYSKFFTELIMILVSWNCRGACGRPFPLRVRELIQRHAVEILILVEPRVSGQKASKIIKRLGFTNWIRVEASGFSGGICLLWRNSEFDVDYVYSNPQLLHCLVTKRKTRESVLVTGVYGETNPSGRMALWDSLKMISGSINGPWLVMGDLNIDLSPEDQSRGATPSTQSMEALKDCIISSTRISLTLTVLAIG